MRLRPLLASLSLVAGGLAAVTLPAPSASAAPEDIVERWCTLGGPRPCVESATHDGVAMAPGTGP